MCWRVIRFDGNIEINVSYGLSLRFEPSRCRVMI